MGGPGVLPRAPGARGAARLDRPRENEHPRWIDRSGPSVRGDRRTDHRRPGEDASREGLRARAYLDLRGRRKRGDRDHGGGLMSDRYQQLVNTPIGRIVTKQIGLPQPVPLERWESGRPVIDGPVLLGAAPGSGVTGPIAKVLAAVGAEVSTPVQDDARTGAADAGLDAG